MCYTRVCDDQCVNPEVFELCQNITPLEQKDEDNPIIWYDFMKSVNTQDPGCQCAVHAIDMYTSLMETNELYDKLINLLTIKPDRRTECNGVKCCIIEHTLDASDFPIL